MNEVKKYERLAEGVVGHFWPEGRDGEEHVSGHLQLLPSGTVQLTLFDRDSLPEIEPYNDVSCFAGATELGEVLLPNVRPQAASLNFGARFTSVARVSGEICIIGARPGLRADEVRSWEYTFDGIDRWTGSRQIEVELHIKQPAEWPVHFSGTWLPPETQSAEAGGATVTLESGGSVTMAPRFATRQSDSLTVSQAVNPDVAGLLMKLHAVQGLLSIAFGRAVLPVHANATFASGGGDEQDLTALAWDRGGFFRDAPPRRLDDPVFRLADIGGVEGLAQWVHVSQEHWRAVVPLNSKHRYTGGFLENRFINAVMAIEYWVRNCLGREGKASFTDRLIESIGPEASAWVGDPSGYGKALWDPYNDLKHGRIYPVGPLYDLADSAETLLLCSILTTRMPTASDAVLAILKGRRGESLGERIRGRLQP